MRNTYKNISLEPGGENKDWEKRDDESKEQKPESALLRGSFPSIFLSFPRLERWSRDIRPY